MSEPGTAGAVDDGRSDLDDVYRSRRPVKSAGDQRQSVGHGNRGDEQVSQTPAWIASVGDNRGVDPAVGPGGFDIEGQRIEGRFGPLQPILSACALGRVLRRGRAGGEFGHRHG